jgi:hypothetical protein
MRKHSITSKVSFLSSNEHKDTKNSIATLKEFYLISSERKYPIPINFPGRQPERISCGTTKECLLGSVITHQIIADATMRAIKPVAVKVTGQRIASNIEACVQNKSQKYYQKSIKACGGVVCIIATDFKSFCEWFVQFIRRGLQDAK